MNSWRPSQACQKKANGWSPNFDRAFRRCHRKEGDRREARENLHQSFITYIALLGLYELHSTDSRLMTYGRLHLVSNLLITTSTENSFKRRNGFLMSKQRIMRLKRRESQHAYMYGSSQMLRYVDERSPNFECTFCLCGGKTEEERRNLQRSFVKWTNALHWIAFHFIALNCSDSQFKLSKASILYHLTCAHKEETRIYAFGSDRIRMMRLDKW